MCYRPKNKLSTVKTTRVYLYVCANEEILVCSHRSIILYNVQVKSWKKKKSHGNKFITLFKIMKKYNIKLSGPNYTSIKHYRMSSYIFRVSCDSVSNLFSPPCSILMRLSCIIKIKSLIIKYFTSPTIYTCG